jgi:hypothetical protein
MEEKENYSVEEFEKGVQAYGEYCENRILYNHAQSNQKICKKMY